MDLLHLVCLRERERDRASKIEYLSQYRLEVEIPGAFSEFTVYCSNTISFPICSNCPVELLSVMLNAASVHMNAEQEGSAVQGRRNYFRDTGSNRTSFCL